ncbi:MAG: PD-(D/E)XK nuclease-like domain-containing protein [Phycisphaerales bacterium]
MKTARRERPKPPCPPLVVLGQGDFERRIGPDDLLATGDALPPTKENTAGIDLGFLASEPAAVYHAKAKDYLSSHALAEFRRCPLLYRRKQLGLIPQRDSASFALGRAAHVLIVEGRDRFEAEFAVGGPVNPRTDQPYGPQTKAFREWAVATGKPAVSEADLALLQEMNASVRSHLFARELLSQGVAEGVVRAAYCGVPCQARIDWINPVDGRGIVDLKTCENLDEFERDAHRYAYIHQMAFYREMVVEASGTEPEVHLVAIEKREPFRCGVWQISRRLLDRAAEDNEHAIEDLKRCRQRGVWPTRYESLRLLDTNDHIDTPIHQPSSHQTTSKENR